MAQIEALEMDAYRAQLTSDVKSLVDKYRAIFGWDVPEIDLVASDRLIVKALRDALEGTANLAGSHGVFNMSPSDHLGLDQRARVMVTIQQGTWKLAR